MCENVFLTPHVGDSYTEHSLFQYKIKLELCSQLAELREEYLQLALVHDQSVPSGFLPTAKCLESSSKSGSLPSNEGCIFSL